MEAMIDELISRSCNLIQQFDLEFSRILMGDSVHQDHDYINDGYTDLESEMSGNSMELLIQEGLEVLSYHSKVVSEGRKELVGFQIEPETHVVESGKETEICAICEEDYEDGDCVGFLNCRHMFHCECVTSLLVVNNTCPLCKSVGVPYYVGP